jgi:hypothetical protein
MRRCDFKGKQSDETTLVAGEGNVGVTVDNVF